MIKEKKAWIKIVEAFMAIILILGVLLILSYTDILNKKGANNIYQFQKTILDEVASNQEYRQKILNIETAEIKEIISSKIPLGYGYDVKICEINEICSLSEYIEEVYSSERIISSTLDLNNPKKLKLFMWKLK